MSKLQLSVTVHQCTVLLGPSLFVGAAHHVDYVATSPVTAVLTD